MFFQEDKCTRGKDYFFNPNITIFEAEAVDFAKRERLRLLKRFNGEETALTINSVKFNKKDTEFVLTLHYNGRSATTKLTQGAMCLKPPEFWTVLHCLLSDISGIEDQTFESWCDDFGISSDSISNKKTFVQCRDNLPLVRNLLGNDFSEIRALTEDELQARFVAVPTVKPDIAF